MVRIYKAGLLANIHHDPDKDTVSTEYIDCSDNIQVNDTIKYLMFGGMHGAVQDSGQYIIGTLCLIAF